MTAFSVCIMAMAMMTTTVQWWWLRIQVSEKNIMIFIKNCSYILAYIYTILSRRLFHIKQCAVHPNISNRQSLKQCGVYFSSILGSNRIFVLPVCFFLSFVCLFVYILGNKLVGGFHLVCVYICILCIDILDALCSHPHDGYLGLKLSSIWSKKKLVSILPCILF